MVRPEKISPGGQHFARYDVDDDDDDENDDTFVENSTRPSVRTSLMAKREKEEKYSNYPSRGYYSTRVPGDCT